MKRWHVIALFILSMTATNTEANDYFVGAGNSSLTSGRFVPALNAGVIFDKWTISGMLAGVRTRAYYSNMYTINALRYRKFGRFLGGSLWSGVGLGVGYGQKGVVTQFETADQDEEIETDVDALIGPAFRVAWLPWEMVYLGFEFTMGIHWGTTGNAWSDEGILALGTRL